MRRGDGRLARRSAGPRPSSSAASARLEGGEPGRVTMRTTLGGRRIVDMLVGEQLPRIC